MKKIKLNLEGLDNAATLGSEEKVKLGICLDLLFQLNQNKI
ncbi:MAG: hypothetical protein AB8G05_02930 [Oligoflexales bacterium]